MHDDADLLRAIDATFPEPFRMDAVPEFLAWPLLYLDPRAIEVELGDTMRFVLQKGASTPSLTALLTSLNVDNRDPELEAIIAAEPGLGADLYFTPKDIQARAAARAEGEVLFAPLKRPQIEVLIRWLERLPSLVQEPYSEVEGALSYWRERLATLEGVRQNAVREPEPTGEDR